MMHKCRNARIPSFDLHTMGTTTFLWYINKYKQFLFFIQFVKWFNIDREKYYTINNTIKICILSVQCIQKCTILYFLFFLKKQSCLNYFLYYYNFVIYFYICLKFIFVFDSNRRLKLNNYNTHILYKLITRLPLYLGNQLPRLNNYFNLYYQ